MSDHIDFPRHFDELRNRLHRTLALRDDVIAPRVARSVASGDAQRMYQRLCHLLDIATAEQLDAYPLAHGLALAVHAERIIARSPATLPTEQREKLAALARDLAGRAEELAGGNPWLRAGVFMYGGHYDRCACRKSGGDFDPDRCN